MVRWMASALYLAVLATGLYFAAAGLAPDRPAAALAVFVTGLAGLLAIEWIPEGGRRRAVVLLAARVVLLVAVVAADPGSFARALFVLVPFFAYFSLGRRVAIGLAAACLLAATTQAALSPGWPADAEVVSDLLMFFVGLVLTLATAAVADGQRRARTQLELAHRQVAELSAAAERNRLARDIHDSVGHHLTAVSVQLEKAEAFRSRDAAVADRAVADARASATRALQEVRESVGALRVEPFSLVAAVAALADGLDDAGFRVAVEATGSETGHARAGLEALYRVVQEALTNARRHAGADVVRVAVRFGDPGPASVEVADNGRGFAVESAVEGGLRGMRERLAALGGVVRIESAPGRGTRVTASVGS
ncbi:sensor histidine kinase [Paractinoplanes lichenicola]|uniref:histidine kinase n=1 Tax=Paractinoplanes lichenicola TaxID=2802976 RepID=A0ABS1W1T4_9ACTN|nr:sensor histidine kinase [Actinoplanes lichenicola]MBL7260696.1 sensor histidine kinase [Actinoplanes lichenicola]